MKVHILYFVVIYLQLIPLDFKNSTYLLSEPEIWLNSHVCAIGNMETKESISLGTFDKSLFMDLFNKGEIINLPGLTFIV